jgi:hypothetical protein
VHIGARVAAEAGPSEVLVSGIVKPPGGSNIRDRDTRTLTGPEGGTSRRLASTSVPE